MKRAFDPAEPELMDRPQAVSDELRVDLRNLRALNRWFGSYRLVRHFLEKWIRPGDNLRVVDLATGSGDIPRLIADHARKVGAQVQIDAVDFQESTLSIARELSADYPEIAFNHADVLEFGAPQTYDVVFCSLALHHFSELDAIRLLRRCREISRGRILVADLRRGPLASAGVWLLTALIFREPMTRVDARLSAARAFSFSELRQLAVQAGWQHFSHERFQLARQAIWNEMPAGMTPSGLSLT
jgi:2-polyprenyl-3-methyl-5-hydroxy-6-metoxy-1,4-benzoquinol methylase